MLFLTGTGDSLQLTYGVTPPTLQVYIATMTTDYDVSTVMSNVSFTTTQPGQTICLAPGGQATKVTFMSMYNADISLTADFAVAIDDGLGVRKLMTASLRPGETLQYVDGAGFSTLTSKGYLRTQLQTINAVSQVQYPPMLASANITSALAPVTGTNYAVYMGKATKNISSSVRVRWKPTTIAATVTWAEMGLAKGPLIMGSTPTLTMVGFQNVAAAVVTATTKTTDIQLSAGQSIAEGDDIWLTYGLVATTVGAVRAMSIQDEMGVGVYATAAAAARPSLVIGVPTAFSAAPTTNIWWANLTY